MIDDNRRYKLIDENNTWLENMQGWKYANRVAFSYSNLDFGCAYFIVERDSNNVIATYLNGRCSND